MCPGFNGAKQQVGHSAAQRAVQPVPQGPLSAAWDYALPQRLANCCPTDGAQFSPVHLRLRRLSASEGLVIILAHGAEDAQPVGNEEQDQADGPPAQGRVSRVANSRGARYGGSMRVAGTAVSQAGGQAWQSRASIM